MTDLLIASSPVEIEAKADELGLSDAEHEAASRLFHDLTSQFELSSLRLEAEGGEPWPQHRMVFGPTDGPVATLLEGLQDRPDIADIAAVPRNRATRPDALFLVGQSGQFTGVLVAARSQDLLDTILGVPPGG